MILRKLAVSAIVASALLIVGCDESDDDDDNAITEFDGNWVATCMGDPEGGFGVQTFVIDGNQVQVTEQYYTDASCTNPDATVFVNSYDLTLTYLDDVTNTSLGNARHVDVETSNLRYDSVPATPEQQTEAEQKGFYETSYDILLALDAQLYFGQATTELDKSTPEKRPMALDLSPLALQ